MKYLVFCFSPLQAGIGFLPFTLPTFMAAADAPTLEGTAFLSHRISVAITGDGVMLIVALIIALMFIAPTKSRERLDSAVQSAKIQTGVSSDFLQCKPHD